MKSLLFHLRVITTIASKDIFDAIKNKTFLGIMVGIGLLMLSSQALAILTKINKEPRAYYYDPGRSVLLRQIDREGEIKMIPVESIHDLTSMVGSSPVPVLGLEIPKAFDSLAGKGSSIILQGYRIHWATTPETNDLISYYQEALSSRIGHQITIQMDSAPIYPIPQEPGFAGMVVIGLISGVVSIGLILVPLLIIEEKENHTLEVLVISPAKTWHLLAGKSLAGLSYCFITALVMFIFTARWIINWESLVLAVVLGSLSAVTLGLLLGVLSENSTIVNLWVVLSLMILLSPVFLQVSLLPKISIPVKTFLQFLPTMAMSGLIWTALEGTRMPGELFWHSAILVAFIGIIIGLLYWRIRKMEP